MMLHVKLVLISQMIVNAALAEHGKHTIVLPQENIAKLLLSRELFQLFRFNFFTEFVNKTVKLKSAVVLLS